MAQDDDVLTAINAVGTAVTTVTTDVGTALADLATLIQEVQNQNPTADPKLAQAITLANTAAASLNTLDGQVQAAIAQVPAPPAQPAQDQPKPAGA